MTTEVVAAGRIPIGDWFSDLVDWATENLGPLFDAITSAVQSTVDWLADVLNAPHPFVMIAIFVVIALLLSGWKLAVFALLGFGLIDNIELWEPTMETLAMVLVAGVVAVVLSIPIGIAAARSEVVSRIVRPVLDLMQTMPAFVYLIPAVFFFGVGVVPGVVATIIFSLPPGVRLTELGIRGVDKEMVEAGEAFGTPPGRILTRIQIPLAMPTIMAGVNQLIMLSLSMVVIASMAGAEALGGEVLEGIQRVDVPKGFEGGVAVVILAIFLDRLTGSFGNGSPSGFQQVKSLFSGSGATRTAGRPAVDAQPADKTPVKTGG
ncbi:MULTISPECIES: ABC transporter permease subunit [Actinomadura]|uniref:ABC transporter permease n=1 Tax=Actinomadura yumaensis TaxID=111807 RepID=A0ABW2CF68_9ACTN|nr:ABC transporter permease subunit [Actinomadura sp. J1-007]